METPSLEAPQMAPLRLGRSESLQYPEDSETGLSVCACHEVGYKLAGVPVPARSQPFFEAH